MRQSSCHSCFSTHTGCLSPNTPLATRSKSSPSSLDLFGEKLSFFNFLTLCHLQFSRPRKSKTFVGHLTFKSCCSSNPNFWHMVQQVFWVSADVSCWHTSYNRTMMLSVNDMIPWHGDTFCQAVPWCMTYVAKVFPSTVTKFAKLYPSTATKLYPSTVTYDSSWTWGLAQENVPVLVVVSLHKQQQAFEI